MNDEVNYWMIATANGNWWGDFQERGEAGINFGFLNDLSLVPEISKIALEKSSQRRMLWQFSHDIKVDDIIIAKSGGTRFQGIGIVNKSYYYDAKNPHYPHCIGVKWLKIGDWDFTARTGRNTVIKDRNKRRIEQYQKILNENMDNHEFVNNMKDKLEKSKNLILRGAPGTGKTYLAKQIAEELTGGNNDQIGFVQFHPSYDYTDFVEGLRPVSSADGQIGFELQDGIFKEFCAKAKEDSDKNFVFIIDEINRGEISKIFGELFFAIEPSYRGEKGAVSTQYANLHETDERFYIPENVYIIGTMNDIDRSVDTFDFAMRRRFRFVEVKAEDRLEMLDDRLGDYAEEAKARLINLNNAISQADGLNSHYHIGPSYFLKLKDLDYDYDVLWSDYLEPLLEDYLRGSYDEVEKLKELKNAYNLIEKEESDETDR